MSKPVKFGTSKDAYFSSQKKEDEASQKKKSNWIIGGICAVVAVAVGFLYYNGKKVNKAVNKVENVGNAASVENLEEQASKITKKIQQYTDYINSNDAKTLRTNIKEMNELIQQSPNEETSKNIFNIMLTSFLKLINLPELTVKERIKDLEDYSNFLEDFEVNDSDLSPSRINANKKCLELETNIMQNDINNNIKNLITIITDKNIDTKYKKEFIENLLKKEEKSEENTNKILDAITQNTQIDDSLITQKDQDLFKLIATMTRDKPESLIVYLSSLQYKIFDNIEEKVDKSLWVYDILTVNRLKKLVSELIAYEPFNYYTITDDKNILIGKKDGKQCTFNFKTQKVNSVQESDKTELEETKDGDTSLIKESDKTEHAETQKIDSVQESDETELEETKDGDTSLIKESDETEHAETKKVNSVQESDKTELEETLKNNDKKPDGKRQAIIKMFKQYQGNSDLIKTLLKIINQNTLENDIKNAKQEALNAFKDSLKDDYSEQNVINALQETINRFYPKDNDACLQNSLVGVIENTDECHYFDDKDIGLPYGLGVCRHMAKLVNHLITSLNQEGIQVCSVDNGLHAWNYLRFKKDDSYIYYRVDTYDSSLNSNKLDDEKKILEAFKTKYGGDIQIDSAFEVACY